VLCDVGFEGVPRFLTCIGGSASPALSSVFECRHIDDPADEVLFTLNHSPHPMSDYTNHDVMWDDTLKAWNFNGHSSFVSIPRPVADDFTITFEFLTQQSTPSASIWSSGAGMVDASVGGTANDDFGISIERGSVMFGVGNPRPHQDYTLVTDTSVIFSNGTVSQSYSFADNLWHTVFVTRKQSTGEMYLYVDEFGFSQQKSRRSLTSPSSIVIGCTRTATGSSSQHFEGKMRNIRIYDHITRCKPAFYSQGGYNGIGSPRIFVPEHCN